MLHCFEDWFGPYPWYADGYKLIETPYLGMEHQSGIAYGNRFLAGYLGRDLSGTGLGLGWDYIVIHESAHEWFGNSITTSESGDLWVHEAFATYAEGLYTECQHGRTAGAAYLIGLRKGIGIPDRSWAPAASRGGITATCTSRARTCCTRSARWWTTTPGGAASCAASTRPSGTGR